MDQAEVAAYRERHRRVDQVQFLIFEAIIVGCGIGVLVIWSTLWSLILAVALVVVLTLLAIQLQLKLSKARWLKRHPELRATELVRRYGGSR